MSKDTNRVSKKRRIKKTKLMCFVFCVYSIVFLIFCLCFYGFRLVKYYKIYNPKSESGEKLELLSTHITQNNSVVYEGDGLYKEGGNYIFKGAEVNNYIMYSNLLWRIVKINNDGTMDIILDEPINDLKWNSKVTSYVKSDVHQYLNDIFLKVLNKDLLVPTTICTDTITDLKKVTCETSDKESYVKLISITDFLNSKTDTTYINQEDSLWTSDAAKDKIWYVGNVNISSDVPSESYRIKPVVTLKSALTLVGGDGKKSTPYKIEEDKKELAVGKYVSLGDDTWIIYQKDKETMNLISKELYNDGNTMYAFSSYSNEFDPTQSKTLAYYLNNTYLNTLSYKDLLLEETWNTGLYVNSYKDTLKKTVKAKVGTYGVADLKFNHTLNNYFMLTPKENGITYTYGKKMSYYKVSRTTAIRPAIKIKTYKIKSGDGTSQSPYQLEVNE